MDGVGSSPTAGTKNKYWRSAKWCARKCACAICCAYPDVAQSVEREFHKLRVAGSIPATRTACASAARPYPGGRARFASVAQFGKSGRLKPGRSQVQLLPGAQERYEVGLFS